MECYTFYSGVKNYEELMAYLDKMGELPDCEMFRYKKDTDDDLIEGYGYIQDETCDEDIFYQIPKTLEDCYGDNDGKFI